MSRKLVIPATFLMILCLACSSYNPAVPRGMNDKAIESDVRSKIVDAVPNRTYSVDVKVDHGVVTLTGWTRNEDDRRKIGDAANSVKGVRTVINNITIQSS